MQVARPPLGPYQANKAICVGVRVSGSTAGRHSDIMNTIILLSILATTAWSGPTIYKIDQEEGTAERVMTAVSSTGQSNRPGVCIKAFAYTLYPFL